MWPYVVLVIYCLICELGLCAVNNVCPTFKDYLTIRNNTNCWHDFTAESKAPEIIIKNGYPLEEFKVTTHDGYTLTMFRIPNPGKQPVFLLHGVQCSASMFVSLRKKSLAFLLADAGYDVWLGNFRGNEYSQEHVNLTVYDKQYWNFRVDDIGLYDVPAMIDFIVYNTGQRGNIIYIGHSLGTSVALIYASEYPEIAKNTIKIFILLSPAYKMTNMLSPYRSFVPFSSMISGLLINLDAVRLFSQAEPSRTIARQVCLESVQLMQFCLLLFNLFFGVRTQMGPEMAPVLLNQFPGGAGPNLFGFVVNMINGKFRRTDYGKRNFDIYGTATPPIFNISKVDVPVYIIYSPGDWATTKQDSINLYQSLPEKIKFGIYEVKDPTINHMDFAFGRYAKEYIYKPILEVIKKINFIKAV